MSAAVLGFLYIFPADVGVGDNSVYSADRADDGYITAAELAAVCQYVDFFACLEDGFFDLHLGCGDGGEAGFRVDAVYSDETFVEVKSFYGVFGSFSHRCGRGAFYMASDQIEFDVAAFGQFTSDQKGVGDHGDVFFGMFFDFHGKVEAGG